MKTEKFKIVMVLLAALFLSACTTYEYHETKSAKASRYTADESLAIDEAALLDVGIVLFDQGLDLLDEEAAAYSNVRQSEAVWFASQLKTVLQYSNAWGAVRTMPDANTIMDLLISGKILDSNGETVTLQVTVVDATGDQWLHKTYTSQASTYAYNPEVNYGKDPFQPLFVELANDLFDARLARSSPQLVHIRNVAKVRFASEFLPQAYDQFLVQENDRYDLLHAPASNDPMILRIDRIRARNDLFLDVIQDYYRVFNGKMAHPYQEWRKTSYREVVYRRQLAEQARKEKIAGAAAILAGLLVQGSNSSTARGAGHIGIFAGASLITSGFQKQNEARLHSATLRELSAALESELEPSVIELEDRSITLSGTVQDQFKEWKGLLKAMFEAENGALPDNDDVTQARNVNAIAESLSAEPAGSSN